MPLEDSESATTKTQHSQANTFEKGTTAGECVHAAVSSRKHARGIFQRSSAEGSFVKKWTGEPQGQYSTLGRYWRRALFLAAPGQKAQGAKWNPERAA